ncbi:hypothetical protein [Methanoculleus chikugoensis]|uniref:hypothetical protein n=1 Tax=Methanoculleus chikugoensis TaxID=118126 RepID=UPI000A99D2AF|nr:hypothetical protein [Methanoculleus chikugoensis]
MVSHAGVDAEGSNGAAGYGRSGGREGLCPPRTESGWWHRYHNRLLVAAVAFSAAAATAFLLIEDAPEYPEVWMGLAIGVGFTLGFLAGHRRQYAQVVAGEFIEANMTKRQRIVRRLSTPAAAVILAGFIAYFALGRTFGPILGFMLGLSLAGWAQYGITLLWEWRHRTTLIAEKGSMYALDAVAEGEPVCL